MITQDRVTLLQIVTLIGTLIGSACYAAQQQKIVRTAIPKKDNSNVRYNEIAQKYSAIETPTNQTVQEFRELLEKDKVFFNRKKECKKELDLLLEDITAQSTVKQIKITKLAAKLYTARKKGFPIDPLNEEALEPFKKTEESVDITNKEQEQPTEEIETPAITPQEETSTIPEGPTVIPSEPPVTKPDTLSWLNNDEAADDSQNVPNYQPEPLEMREPTLALAPFLQKPYALDKESTLIPLKPTLELSSAIGIKFDIITEQLEEKIHTSQQKIIVQAFAENTESTLSIITPSEQVAILNAAAFAIDVVSKQGADAVQECVLPLVNTVSQALVPTTMIQTMQNNQISIPQKQQFDLNTLPKILFAAGKSATLDADLYKPFVQNISTLFEDFSYKAALIAPTVTAALLLAHEDNTQGALGAQFYTLLESFDALLDGVDIQVQALQDSLKTYTDKNLLSKKFTENWEYVLGGTYTPSTLVPKLILLYELLNTVGPAIIDCIELYIKQYGPVMNSDIVEAFENGHLLMKSQNLPKKEIQKHKRLYLKDLKSKLSWLEKLIQQGSDAITDAKTKKELQKQFTTLKKKFNEESRKKEPVKKRTPASRTSQRIKLPNIGAFTTRVKSSTQDTVKKEPSKKPTFQEIELPQKPLPKLLPPTTALPVINQEFEEFKTKIRNLNPQTATNDEATNLKEQLNNFKTTVGTSEYASTDKLLSQKIDALQIRIRNENRAKNLRDTIAEITNAKNNQMIVSSTTLKTWKNITQRPSTDDTIKQLKIKLNTALEDYLLFLISIGKRKSSSLHATASTLVTEQTEQLIDIQKIANSIVTLNINVLPQEKTTIKSIVMGLCAAYDAILHALYTPIIFDPLMVSNENKPKSEIYLQLIDTAIESVKIIKECIEILQQFIPEETQKAFNASNFDISTLDTNLLKNDAYVYEVPVGTVVQIGDLSIKTLQALNGKHSKEYEEIIKEWQARIQNNGEIEILKQADLSKLTQQELETLTEQLKTLSEKTPTLFETDEILKELVEKVQLSNENNTIKNLIAQLLNKIQKAQNDFETNKRITQIDFETQYKNIQESIGTLDSETNPFKPEIENLKKQFADYLTIIAEANVQNISNFPDRTHDERFAQDINSVTIPTSFTNMITQLKTLGFLADIDNTENSFSKLYTIILQGYGYILATFDALTAKLHDGAQDTKSWGTFFATIMGSSKQTQYTSAQFIIDKLLKPIELRRSWYYQTLIEPYFTESKEIQDYQKGALNLLKLDLKNITTEDGSYRFMRTQIIIKPYGEKNTTMITSDAITGKHIRNYDYQSNSIVHGGEAQYTKIIDDWNTLITEILKTEFQNQQVKEIQDMLNTILTIPFGEVTNKKEIELLPTVKPTYKTTFNDMYSSSNKYKDTDTVYAFLNEILHTNNDYREKELNLYLNDFFIDLSLLLSNPNLITNLKTLKEKKLLTPEMHHILFLVCGDSFVLLDSVISWAYKLIDYYTNTNPDQNNVTKIGTLLAQYEPYITHIITNVLLLTPYLSAEKLNEYTNQGLVISGFVQNPTQKGTVPGIYEFFIGTAPTALQSMGAAFNIINPIHIQPKNLLGLTFLQEGTHTAQTIKKSLELLKAIPQKIGVPSGNSIGLEILLKLNPLYEILTMSYTPSSEQLTQLIVRMEPVFATIQDNLKKSPQNNKQLSALNSIAQLLISNYKNKFEKQTPTQAQKDAYIKLTTLFLQSFTNNINPNLQKNLNAIKTTGKSLTSVKQPRRQNQQPDAQTTKPNTGIQQKIKPAPTKQPTETGIGLYKESQNKNL